MMTNARIFRSATWRKLSAPDKSKPQLFSSFSTSDRNGRITSRYLTSFYAYTTKGKNAKCLVSHTERRRCRRSFSFGSNLLLFLPLLYLALVSSISIQALVFPRHFKTRNPAVGSNQGAKPILGKCLPSTLHAPPPTLSQLLLAPFPQP
jgi:hypothetical protein